MDQMYHLYQGAFTQSSEGTKSTQIRMSCGSINDKDIQDFVIEYLAIIRPSKTRAELQNTAIPSNISTLLNAKRNITTIEASKSIQLAQRTIEMFSSIRGLYMERENIHSWFSIYPIAIKWRKEAIELVNTTFLLLEQSQNLVIQAWDLLNPPFSRQKIKVYEGYLNALQQNIQITQDTLQVGKQNAYTQQKIAAACFIQHWLRSYNAKRQLQMKKIMFSRHHRGLIPGFFDTISRDSKLIVHKHEKKVMLEFPIVLAQSQINRKRSMQLY